MSKAVYKKRASDLTHQELTRLFDAYDSGVRVSDLKSRFKISEKDLRTMIRGNIIKKRERASEGVV